MSLNLFMFSITENPDFGSKILIFNFERLALLTPIHMLTGTFMVEYCNYLLLYLPKILDKYFGNYHSFVRYGMISPKVFLIIFIYLDLFLEIVCRESIHFTPSRRLYICV